MPPSQLLNVLAAEGLHLRAADTKIEVSGQINRLSDELRSLIRSNRTALLQRLSQDDYTAEERDAIQWSDTDEAWNYLDFAMNLFDAPNCSLLDSAMTQQIEAGLISGAEVDAWLSQCDHRASVGTWHVRDGEKCCRFCSGIYETIMTRERDFGQKTKSPGAATPRLF